MPYSNEKWKHSCWYYSYNLLATCGQMHYGTNCLVQLQKVPQIRTQFGEKPVHIWEQQCKTTIRKNLPLASFRDLHNWWRNQMVFSDIHIYINQLSFVLKCSIIWGSLTNFWLWGIYLKEHNSVLLVFFQRMEKNED